MSRAIEELENNRAQTETELKHIDAASDIPAKRFGAMVEPHRKTEERCR
jgi:hypothetical protein